MAIKKYCIYFPYHLDTELLESIINDEDLYTCIQQYIINDDNLDSKLETIKRFIRFNQESELILLNKDNKIHAVIFSRDGYKPYNILPVINDMNNMQCFIAISNCWVELEEITLCHNINNTDNIKITKDITSIQNLYDANRSNLIPLIEQSLERLFKQYEINQGVKNNEN